MSLKQIAELIPVEYRTEMLELGLIDSATGNGTDANMQYLGVIWKQYVEPDFSGDCNLCYGRLLKNLRELKPVLIELEKERKLLEQLI